MKRIAILSVVIGLSSILTACGSSEPSTEYATGSEKRPSPTPEPKPPPTPDITKPDPSGQGPRETPPKEPGCKPKGTC